MAMIAFYLRVSMDQLCEYQNDTERFVKRINSPEIEDDFDFIDIDTTWDGIFYMLTGAGAMRTNSNWLKLLFSDNLLDEVLDLGHGPAHILYPEEVFELNIQLQKVPFTKFVEYYDPYIMHKLKIYPMDWHSVAKKEQLINEFDKLQQFFEETSQKKFAIISYIAEAESYQYYES